MGNVKSAALKRLALAIAATVIAVAAGTSAPAANAGLISSLTGALLPTCGTSFQAFGQWGDMNYYFAPTNNGLESGSNGWSLYGGAYVGSGNEPYFVGGYGTHSLVLPPGASAYSAASCINLLDPTLRGFARANGANGPLRVQVVFYGLTGNLLGILNSGDQSASAFSQWAPTSSVPSLLALPLGTDYFRVKLTSAASAGTWQFDDLFVDPYLMR